MADGSGKTAHVGSTEKYMFYHQGRNAHVRKRNTTRVQTEGFLLFVSLSSSVESARLHIHPRLLVLFHVGICLGGRVTWNSQTTAINSGKNFGKIFHKKVVFGRKNISNQKKPFPISSALVGSKKKGKKKGNFLYTSPGRCTVGHLNMPTKRWRKQSLGPIQCWSLGIESL